MRTSGDAGSMDAFRNIIGEEAVPRAVGPEGGLRALPGGSPAAGLWRHASLASGLLVATAFAGATWVSWRRLGSLIVDGGKELDVPRRLLEDAALYRAFGVHSDTEMWAGLVTAALACLGLYLLARRFVGPFTSSWVAIAF